MDAGQAPIGQDVRFERAESGLGVLTVYYKDDPDKASDDWVKLHKQGVDPDMWAQEMEMDETIRVGEKVYITYKDSLHAPKEYKNKPFPVFHGSLWYGGWDVGQTVNPAFVLLQVHPTIKQIMVMGEVVGEPGEVAEAFCPRVVKWIEDNFPEIAFDAPVEHAADPSCMQRSGTDGRTVRHVAKRHGILLKPQTNVWQVRKNAVTWALVNTLQEEITDNGGILVRPRMVINEFMCPWLVDGFRGSYKLRDLPPDVDPDGPNAVINPMPLKNRWSHVQDALQYAVLMAKRDIERTGERTSSYFGD